MENAGSPKDAIFQESEKKVKALNFLIWGTILDFFESLLLRLVLQAFSSLLSLALNPPFPLKKDFWSFGCIVVFYS